MRVGWLADACTYVGGAERTQQEFHEAAPEGVEVVDCRPGEPRPPDLRRVVIHNCLTYSPEELTFDVPTFKYFHDVAPHISRDQWAQLNKARHICCSPLQRHKMGLDEADLIPPAVPLDAFREAAENAGERKGSVAVGTWMNPGKAPDAAAQWAAGNGGIDFYGEGPYAPKGSRPVDYDDLPEVLARYKTFVHLPRWIEPFGRTIVEAWAAGNEIVVNRLVGARYWITEEPGKLDSAAQDFWRLVIGD